MNIVCRVCGKTHTIDNIGETGPSICLECLMAQVPRAEWLGELMSAAKSQAHNLVMCLDSQLGRVETVTEGTSRLLRGQREAVRERLTSLNLASAPQTARVRRQLAEIVGACADMMVWTRAASEDAQSSLWAQPAGPETGRGDYDTVAKHIIDEAVNRVANKTCDGFCPEILNVPNHAFNRIVEVLGRLTPADESPEEYRRAYKHIATTACAVCGQYHVNNALMGNMCLECLTERKLPITVVDRLTAAISKTTRRIVDVLDDHPNGPKTVLGVGANMLGFDMLGVCQSLDDDAYESGRLRAMFGMSRQDWLVSAIADCVVMIAWIDHVGMTMFYEPVTDEEIAAISRRYWTAMDEKTSNNVLSPAAVENLFGSVLDIPVLLSEIRRLNDRQDGAS